MISPKLQSFFEAKFTRQDEGCWLWTGAKLPRGYGTMYSNYKNYYAHRIAYELYVQPDFPKHLHVLHRCDNPSCVNPAHLFLGTNQDNNNDCRQKGRNLTGENHPHAKLTDKELLEIYDLCRLGPYPIKDIAKFYNCSSPTVSNLKAGRGRIQLLLQSLHIPR